MAVPPKLVTLLARHGGAVRGALQQFWTVVFPGGPAIVHLFGQPLDGVREAAPGQFQRDEAARPPCSAGDLAGATESFANLAKERPDLEAAALALAAAYTAQGRWTDAEQALAHAPALGLKDDLARVRDRLAAWGRSGVTPTLDALAEAS